MNQRLTFYVPKGKDSLLIKLESLCKKLKCNRSDIFCVLLENLFSTLEEHPEVIEEAKTLQSSANMLKSYISGKARVADIVDLVGKVK